MSKITEALRKAAKEREERLRQQQQEDKVSPPSKEVPSQSISKQGPPRALPTVPISPPSTAGLDPHLVTYFEPYSPASEQYRLIRTNIQSLNAKNAPHTLVISSSTYGEGKTITAINLAIIMAQDINKPILLIDGDIWKPQIYQYLNLTPKAGLADFLTDNISLESILLPTKINNLTVLPGSKTVSNPSSLLESAKMKHLLTEIKSRFEYIIIDTAPVLAVTDAGIIGRETDGVLLVIKADSTKREVIQRAQSVLAETKTEIVGYILTHVEHPIPDFIYRHL